MNIRAWGGIALLMWAVQACAADVAVSGASVRATAPGQDSAAVSLHLVARQEAKLVAVTSPVAERVEIHVMKHENGMMEMRAVDSLALPANQEVVLGSGSHLMLVGLKRPLKAGERVPLAVTVEFAGQRRETLKVVATVRPLGQGGGGAGHGMQGHDMEGHGGAGMPGH